MATNSSALPPGLTVYIGTVADLVPCCYISESEWTWLGCTMLCVSLLVIATLKYYKKVMEGTNIDKSKNERVLRLYAMARQKGARTRLPDGPVHVHTFKEGVERRRNKPVILRIEYSSAIQVKEVYLQTVGQCRSNRARNRDPDVVPFDANRVRLRGRSEKEGDYVNASAVEGLAAGPGYVVTQGPLENTVNDFWLMAWQQKVEVVVMLTRTFDFIKVQCVQYWPAKLHTEEKHGDICVTVTEEARYANFVRRLMTVRREGGPAGGRTLAHYHYTEWPTYSNPGTGALLDFRRRVARRMDDSRLGGPCLVHCDTGTGRSGVFLQLDANIRWAEETGTVDVYGYMRRLRAQRVGLVATEEQYRFVYSLLEEFLLCGETTTSVDAFLRRATAKREVRSVSQYSMEGDAVDYEKEARLIAGLVRPLTMGDCAGGHRADNRHKNRQVLLVPPDSHRPYITSFQGNVCTDYINAVFLDGLTRCNELIVTEWPMTHTLPDFWSMVYDHDVSSVVVLDNPPASNKFPAIWPEPGRVKKCGSVFSLETAEDDSGASPADNDDILSLRVHISKKEVAPHRRTQAMNVDENQGRHISSLSDLMVSVVAPSKRCRVFQLRGAWPRPRPLLGLMAAVRAWRAGRPDLDGPSVVVSGDGCERVGVYCAAVHLRDRLVRDNEVDMIQAVATAKLHRPQLVGDIAEYRFCYQVAQQLVTEVQMERASGQL